MAKKKAICSKCSSEINITSVFARQPEVVLLKCQKCGERYRRVIKKEITIKI